MKAGRGEDNEFRIHFSAEMIGAPNEICPFERCPACMAIFDVLPVLNQKGVAFDMQRPLSGRLTGGPV